VGTVHRGWVMVGNGDVAEGVSLLRSGSAAYRATGTEMWTTHFLALQAKACEIAGKIGEGLTLLDDALQDLERTGMHWLASELNRHKGQLLLRQGHSEAAEELYRKALSVAEEQRAKLWELRAAVSLAGSAATRGAAPKRAMSSRRSMVGSPRASTPPISKRRRRCSTSWRKFVITTGLPRQPGCAEPIRRLGRS
jgi:predicted ATPase